MATINNWKLVTESEVEKYENKMLAIHDPHYDMDNKVLGVVATLNGQTYLCALDYYSGGIYPVVERNGRLELLNSLTAGKQDGRNLVANKEFFKAEENFELLRNLA